jgi:type I restriction enzyme R subunit
MPGKQDLSETEIRTRYITKALEKAGWKLNQIREEYYFTDGPIRVGNEFTVRGKALFADYVLFHPNQPNLPIAVIEAKDNNHTLDAGIQQALKYAETLDTLFAYSSNGDGFLEHDRSRTVPPAQRELTLDAFPPPDELWQRYITAKDLDPAAQAIVQQDYFFERGGRMPRYYQRIAINRTVEVIAKGQNRALLVMATGTGKTYTAFQIMWRLWRSRSAKRILLLADRHILIDQAKNNDFRHFGNAMVKIDGRTVEKSYEVYLALYQSVSGTEEERNIYKQFSPDFFDLVIVDECHRGSARADSAWREILEYFGSAVQIGLTATPKETADTSNIDYFGEPVYTYSLKQGIQDGFLAPYKVIRVRLEQDEEGYTPTEGEVDRYGYALPQQHFVDSDMDKLLVIDERTRTVARRITEYLKKTNRFHKTIVFCEDIDHAARMRRALIEENLDLYTQDNRYIMRIVGEDTTGKQELDNFINPEERYPVIATTSKLLSTGVDAQTCHLIVLDQNINSMTEFKQIIGRGTRIREDFGKRYFTIMDFRNATRLFRDPTFDGEPVQVMEVGPDDEIDLTNPEPTVAPTDPDTGTDGSTNGSGQRPSVGIIEDDQEDQKRRKFYIDGQPADILTEHVQYIDAHGNLVTQSFEQVSRKNVLALYQTLDDFLQHWNAADRKDAIIAELLDQGILLDQLQDKIGQDLDPFDLICHIAFDQPPVPRSERARNVQKRDIYTQHGDTARRVLAALLDKYAEEGIHLIELAQDQSTAGAVFQMPPFNQIGRPIEIVKAFGGRDQYFEALRRLEDEIYKTA